MHTMKLFSSMSDLYINTSKSRLFVAGVSNEELASLQNITQFPLGDFPVRYLGVPFIHGRLKASHFAPLIEKVSTHIRD